jgi:LacI family repressor for deo operon, udp, cdd, tsx, nupC, and nupG
MDHPVRNRGTKADSSEPTSIKDVARIAGVSIATVSRCINDPGRVRAPTRKRVEDAIRQTGYSPNTLAQSFRRGKTRVIMVVLPSVGDPFFTEVMSGVREVAAEKGYSLLINETQFNTMTADEIGAIVVSRQADGIVLLASVSPFGTEVLSSTNNRRLPVVVGCEVVSLETTGYPSVHIDNQAAAREMTDYLIGQGHRRIAFIHGQEASLLTKDREDGFRASMSAAGLDIEEGWITGGNLNISDTIEATRRLLGHANRPTAIFCANDEMAMGCLHAIKSAGLNVPHDVSVVGFDDIRYAAILDPPLTTIHQPARLIGERVMYRLFRDIEEGRNVNAEPEIVPHKLVTRESVAPPPRTVD